MASLQFFGTASLNHAPLITRCSHRPREPRYALCVSTGLPYYLGTLLVRSCRMAVHTPSKEGSSTLHGYCSTAAAPICETALFVAMYN